MTDDSTIDQVTPVLIQAEEQAALRTLAIDYRLPPLHFEYDSFGDAPGGHDLICIPDADHPLTESGWQGDGADRWFIVKGSCGRWQAHDAGRFDGRGQYLPEAYYTADRAADVLAWVALHRAEAAVWSPGTSRA